MPPRSAVRDAMRSVLGAATWPPPSPKERRFEKGPLQRRLLQPLPQTLRPAGAEEEGLAPTFEPQPRPFPERPPLPPGPRLDGRAIGSRQPHCRPPTAERNRRPLRTASFSAPLHLRGPKEAPGPLGPFAASKEAFVLQLETQQEVCQLLTICAEGQLALRSGACLTIWTAAQLEEVSPASAELEPLVAQRVDKTLAVEPVVLVAEKPRGDEAIRLGEGFRLRAATVEDLYLGHRGLKDGLEWKVAVREKDGTLRLPPNARFAAHGGELGAPLLLGRPLTLRRVHSPPPPEESEEDEEVSASESSEREHTNQPRQRRQAMTKKRQAASTPRSAAAMAFDEGLFSRFGDDSKNGFHATLLPCS